MFVFEKHVSGASSPLGRLGLVSQSRAKRKSPPCGYRNTCDWEQLVKRRSASAAIRSDAPTLQFRSTNTSRTRESAQSYALGVFNHRVELPPSLDEDPLLKVGRRRPRLRSRSLRAERNEPESRSDSLACSDGPFPAVLCSFTPYANPGRRRFIGTRPPKSRSTASAEGNP